MCVWKSEDCCCEAFGWHRRRRRREARRRKGDCMQEERQREREREVSYRNKICLLDAFVRQILITFILTRQGEKEGEGRKSACSFIILR